MPILLRRRRAANLALGFLLLAGGCASPLWKYDHYVVDGALLGDSCRATIDGHPFVGDVAGLGPKIQLIGDTNSPRGWTITGVVCRGLVLEFAYPRGTLPSPGRYRIVSEMTRRDTANVKLSVYNGNINEGRWPYAPTGVYLEGQEGYLQLEEFTGTSVRATFHAIARRRPNGE